MLLLLEVLVENVFLRNCNLLLTWLIKGSVMQGEGRLPGRSSKVPESGPSLSGFSLNTAVAVPGGFISLEFYRVNEDVNEER